MKNNNILFYSTSEQFGEFSNFSKHPVKLDGKLWPTSEHYFQAQKFKEKADIEKVRKASSPSIAAKIGRNRKLKIRKGWDSIRMGVMKKVVKAKFTQHEELLYLLLSTDQANLIEHTSNDAFWGDGGDSKGKNMLGKILMAVRDDFRNSDNYPTESINTLKSFLNSSKKSWVLFRNGTYVTAEKVSDDLRETSKEILRASAIPQPGTFLGDFSVMYLENESGWIVGFSYDNIFVYVPYDKENARSEITAGFLARNFLEEDIKDLFIVHIEETD